MSRELRVVLRKPAVYAATGWGREKLRYEVNEGNFPEGFPLNDSDSKNGVRRGWYEDVIICWQAWREARINGETKFSWKQWYAERTSARAKCEGK